MGLPVETLYETHGPMVLRRCLRLLRDEAKAFDAMHDVFVEILRRNEALHDRAPASLLLRTATYVCLNRLRSDRRRPEDRDQALLLAIAATEEESPESQAAARQTLEAVFGESPASTRVMAVLHYLDRLTLEEVAAEVGLSVSGVRKRLRGLQQRLALFEAGGTEHVR
jgi:RNA polymerase sigma-70 factor (ECF subfamily)